MLSAVIAALIGCGRAGDPGAPREFPIAREPRTRPPIINAAPMRPLVPAPDAPPAAAPATAGLAAAAPDLPVEARVLVITADGTDAAAGAITSTLAFLGTPYDLLNATSGPALTAGALADDDRGRYQAIFIDIGDLSVNGASAFSTDEWNTLAAYEARFGVRQVALYTFPTAAYGLAAGPSVDPKANPIQAICSAAGAAAFAGANCAMPVVIDDGWAYPARTVDDQTTPLLTDGAGNVLAAIHTTSDGREALALTFAQAPYALATLELAYGLVSWATRGLFIGERHVYLQAQIDDLFLASKLYPGTGATYRITGDDIGALAAWQDTRRANPLVAGLRLAWAANMMGARAGDGLTAQAVALGPTFGWISHTWDHLDLTGMNYADAFTEFSQNDQALRGRGLQPYATANLVTPGITGLDNPLAMQAAFDVGIRQLVSDTSIKGENNPTPNAGLWNARVPGILEIPRIPTDLDYDVSVPSEWAAAYNAREGTSYTYDQIVDAVSRVLARYLLEGNNDPWMFHQANVRGIGAGHSLLGDLLGATIDRYLAMATFPIVSPTMDDLARRVTDRMTFDASGVSAIIQPGAQITVHVANAARVPITGLCVAGGETYGGQQIATLDLAAGAATTLSLTDCNPGGTTGTGGAGGTGGTGGAGGAAGSGGAGGAGAAGTTETGAAGSAGSTGAGEGGASGEAGETGGGAGGSIGPGSGGSSGDPGAAGTNGGPLSGCDCAMTGGTGGPGLGLMAFAAAAALSHRRRRRRPVSAQVPYGRQQPSAQMVPDGHMLGSTPPGPQAVTPSGQPPPPEPPVPVLPQLSFALQSEPAQNSTHASPESPPALF